MYHPKGIAVDDSGNIYIADTSNVAIRKISDAGNPSLLLSSLLTGQKD